MATLAEARRAKRRHAAEIMALPNVTGVATGRRSRAGRPSEEYAIVVFVSREEAPENLAVEDLIQEAYGGVPTEVRVESFDKRDE